MPSKTLPGERPGRVEPSWTTSTVATANDAAVSR
jgi:hypothetical protein